ncbi:hypothetical protein [Microbacterium sp. SS28]|uniref:hypothetical protein n=1 Tax=Microbacterium sp. SS28 TaxID=2919948 RepID=UPI001FAAD014|nr:hypothetical protein [Microbacterium sp. SS28]
MIRALHVVTSISWAAAVAVFLVIAILGWSAPDTRVHAGAYAALATTLWVVIVPLTILSFLTGVLTSVLSRWGLTRHWWVLFKLVLTTGATALLLVHTRVVDAAADAALGMGHDMEALQLQLVIDSAAAFGVLALIAGLGYIKPRGITPWSDSSRAN